MTAPTVEIVGRKETLGCDLALIHGWGIGKAAWQAVLPRLESQFRVHLVDLPGYGTAEPVPSPSPQTQASFVYTAAALIEALPAGCTLCGWSLGALLALQAAALAPQRVKRLILVGGTPSFSQRDGWPHAQPPALLDTFGDAVAKDASGTLQRFVALLNQGDAQARLVSRALSRDLLAAPLPDTATLLAGLGWLRDVDLRSQIASIAAPTLLIHGQHDPLMPLAAAQSLHRTLPRAQLEVFADAAHAPFLNDPERFAVRVSEFCHAEALD